MPIKRYGEMKLFYPLYLIEIPATCHDLLKSIITLPHYEINQCSFFSGARVRIESEIQGGEVHNRTGSHGERERVGLGARSTG